MAACYSWHRADLISAANEDSGAIAEVSAMHNRSEIRSVLMKVLVTCIHLLISVNVQSCSNIRTKHLLVVQIKRLAKTIGIHTSPLEPIPITWVNTLRPDLLNFRKISSLVILTNLQKKYIEHKRMRFLNNLDKDYWPPALWMSYCYIC